MWSETCNLSPVSPYNQSYIPKEDTTLPAPLTRLFKPENKELELAEVLKKCDEELEKQKITEQEAEAIEFATRNQSSSQKWFEQRAWQNYSL